MSTTTFTWTRERFDRAAAAGAFEDSRVELLDGEVHLMTPESPLHSATKTGLVRLLSNLYHAEDVHVRAEAPLAIGDLDLPVPDAIVVRGGHWRYLRDYPAPADCLLVVEVALSSVDSDLGDKARRYAAASVERYWVLLPNARQLIAFGQPDAHGYHDRIAFHDGDSITPPGTNRQIAVADLLPPNVT